MQARRKGRWNRRRVGTAVAAACVITGVGATPASALELCQLLDTCKAKVSSTASTPVAPDPGGREFPDQAVPAPGKAFGFNSSLTLARVTTPDQEVLEAARAGGRHLRFSITWREFQPEAGAPPVPGAHPGSTIALLDELYAQALARGIRLILIPAGAPLWATRYGTCSALDVACVQARNDYQQGSWRNRFVPDPAHLPALRTFVRAVKRRWPQALVEAWNEPNLHFFRDAPDWVTAPPEEFVGIQCAAYAGSKDVNADPVLAAGWAATESAAEYDAYVGAVYRGGGQECWDLANMHMYFGDQTTFGADTRLARFMRMNRDLRARYGDNDPLWITETGFTTTGGAGFAVSEAMQADALRRLYNRLVTMPDVAAVLVHTLRDRSGSTDDKETGYGLQRADGSPKAAFCALTLMAGALAPGCPA